MRRCEGRALCLGTSCADDDDNDDKDWDEETVEWITCFPRG